MLTCRCRHLSNAYTALSRGAMSSSAPTAPACLVRLPVSLEALEKPEVDLIRRARFQSKLELLKHANKLVTIDKLDRRDAVANRFLSSLRGERPSCDDDA